MVAVEQHGKQTETKWQRHEQAPAVRANDGGTQQHKNKADRGRDNDREHGAAELAARDDSAERAHRRPRRRLFTFSLLARRQKAQQEKKQQVQDRKEEQYHQPNGLPRVP